MNTITIAAASPESALALYEALSEFRVQLRETDDGRRFIDVELDGSDREIIDVLNAVENYVTHRNDGPALVAIDGRNYTLHAVP